MAESRPVVRLQNGLSIKDVMNNKFPQFSADDSYLNEMGFESETNMLQVYRDDLLLPHVLDPKAFDELRQDAFKLTEDGMILKKIEIEGNGGIPNYDEDYYIVDVYYAAYTELDEMPFDIVAPHLQKPKSIKIGCNMVIPGFEMAITSMRISEKAKFLVHPFLAYRDGYNLPRIPPQATVLFSIELLKVTLDPDPGDKDQVKVLMFQKILQKSNKIGDKAKELICRGNVNAAIQKYREAEAFLTEACYKDEEEEKTAHNQLLMIYSNLAICYLKRENYKKVCCMFNNARYLSYSLAWSHIKLLYNSAKALRFLGDYREAEKRLQKALKIDPNNKELLNEMKKLKESVQGYRKKETEMFKKMLNFDKQSDENVEQNIVDEFIDQGISAFVKQFRLILDEFQQYEDLTIELDLSLTMKELEWCKLECR